VARVFDRSKRVASQIQKDLSELIRERLQDPRVSMLTISAVTVSREFSHAKIYFRMMGQPSDDEIKTLSGILNQASRFLRKELGAKLRLRIIPQLHFEYDHVIDHGDRLEKVIEKAVGEDKKKHEQLGD